MFSLVALFHGVIPVEILYLALGILLLINVVIIYVCYQLKSRWALKGTGIYVLAGILPWALLYRTDKNMVINQSGNLYTLPTSLVMEKLLGTWGEINWFLFIVLLYINAYFIYFAIGVTEHFISDKFSKKGLSLK
jgi:hypothetical protein